MFTGTIRWASSVMDPSVGNAVAVLLLATVVVSSAVTAYRMYGVQSA